MMKARRLLRGTALFAAVAVTVMTTGLAASVSGAPAPQVRAAAIFSIPNPSSVNGWDRGHFLGTLNLINKFGWRLAIAEDVPFPRLAETAAGYAEAGYDVVVFTSSGHIAAWNEVAPKYPKTWFVLMSLVDRLPNAPNVAAYSPDLYAYGAMAGATAALVSKTGKIGSLGGVPVFGLIVMFSGVIEGAKAVRPDVEITTSFTGDWGNVPRARELAALQVRRGVDVIVANAGPATKGILEAAEDAKSHIIGYATDWYRDSPSSVLTSVLMNIDHWYLKLGADYAGGKLRREIVTFGPDTFSLTDFHGKLPPGLEQRVRDTVARIQNGQLKIPLRMHELGR